MARAAAPPAFALTIQSGPGRRPTTCGRSRPRSAGCIPSCAPDGRWTDPLAIWCEFHRSVSACRRRVHRPDDVASRRRWHGRRLWDPVARPGIFVPRMPRSRPTPLMRWRSTGTPWQTPLAFDLPPPRSTSWSRCSRCATTPASGRCSASRSTVDVLLHHRDTGPVTAGAFAACCGSRRRPAPGRSALGAADLVAFLAGVLAAGIGGVPGTGRRMELGDHGWWLGDADTAHAARRTVAEGGVGRCRSQRSHERASCAGTGTGRFAGRRSRHRTGRPPATVADLVQAWPHAALRVAAGDDAHLTSTRAAACRLTDRRRRRPRFDVAPVLAALQGEPVATSAVGRRGCGLTVT